MKVVTVPLSELRTDPQNARTHDARNLSEIRKSLERWGQYRPFVVQQEGMIVRVGNGMYQAMQELGWTEAQAVVLNLSDAEAAALAIMDNRSAELAEWDHDTLDTILAGLPEDLVGLSGFCEEEIGALLDGMGGEEPLPPPPPVGPDGGQRTGEADTCCVFGAYRFAVSREAYNSCLEHIRQAVGFDEASIIEEIRRRLRL